METRACVIGWPVAHSRSPAIHRYWLDRYGIDGAYEKEAVTPEALPAFLHDLAARGYVGANVTLPHKEAALLGADVVHETARAIGAANTLWLDEDGRLHAANTDAYGFMTNLEAFAPAWNETPAPALILGAGGAARAVLHGLAAAGVPRIVLANRTQEKAEALARLFGDRMKTVETVPWEDKAAALADCKLLINTTSLGMTGQPPLDLDLATFPQGGIVTDIVYVPLETPLLAEARARGLTAVDGLGMLLHQAVPGFERWFGVRPEVTPDLREHILATLGEA